MNVRGLTRSLKLARADRLTCGFFGAYGAGGCCWQEDEQLRKLVDQLGCKKWSLIASKMQTKASKQVRRLGELVGALADSTEIPTCHRTAWPDAWHGNTGAQCRRRWQNYLNATVKKGSWSPEVRPHRRMVSGRSLPLVANGVVVMVIRQGDRRVTINPSRHVLGWLDTVSLMPVAVE